MAAGDVMLLIVIALFTAACWGCYAMGKKHTEVFFSTSVEEMKRLKRGDKDEHH